MDPEIELRIFGYVDPDPAPAGSWKAEVLRLAESGLDDESIERLAGAVSRMRGKAVEVIVEPRIRPVPGPTPYAENWIDRITTKFRSPGSPGFEIRMVDKTFVGPGDFKVLEDEDG